MPASLATVSNILKEVYDGKIRDQLNEEVIALKRIERSSDGIDHQAGGKYVTFPIRVRRNQGIGSRNEMEALPTAGQQGYESVRIPLKYQYGVVQMSGQTMELANDNYQAFASALDLEMTGLKNDLVKDQNRQIYGTSRGTLATATAIGSGVNTVQVAATTGSKYVEVGQQVDVMDATGVTPKASNRQVTAVNPTTGVVTLSGATFSTVVGDIIVRTGNANRELNGLASLVTATGVLQNVDPATVPQWAATVNTNGGTLRALSEGAMITMTDLVRVQGGKTSLILCGLGVRRAYWQLLVQQRRFTDTKNFAGGLTGLAFNNGSEIPVVEDPDAPYNLMYFIDESSLKFYRPRDWSWMDRDNATWKWMAGFDAYQAVYNIYQELATTARNANAVLGDLIEG